MKNSSIAIAIIVCTLWALGVIYLDNKYHLNNAIFDVFLALLLIYPVIAVYLSLIRKTWNRS